jgi:GT2 family glycosyltransferase
MTDARPPLSVIIVSYRCKDLVLDCLASLDADPDTADTEILLLDNASRDGTVDAVRAAHPRVSVTELTDNVGFARANNLGLRAARGQDVLLLNPDTVVPVGTLDACLRALRDAPSVGMLGCKLVQPDGRLDHACKRGFPTPASALWHFMGLSRALPSSPRFAAYTAGHIDPDRVSPVDAINGAFMLIRREALDDVGPLDERFWMYGEDLDWCRRFWDHGWQVLYWPGATVVHVKGGSATKSRGWRANKAFHEAMWLFYAKHRQDGRISPSVAGVRAAIYLKLCLSALRSLLRRRAVSVRNVSRGRGRRAASPATPARGR